MSSTSAAEGFLAEKLQNVRDALLKKGLYLGTPHVSEKLVWDRDGNADRLVTAEAAAAASDALKTHASDPSAERPTVPEPAVLSAVVFIPKEDYWLTACGMWKGPTEATRTFADVKPTCTGQAPEHAVFADDFDVVLKNLDALMQKEKTDGFKAMKGLLINSMNGNRKIKFRHILFEVSISFSFIACLTLPNFSM